MKRNDITRRDFLGASAGALLEATVPQRAATQGTQQPRESKHARTNLILFMPDELRADALACYGNSLTKTPNFDRLAKQGTRFANCHVQFPLCGPSRCSLLTGWPVSVRGHRSNEYFLRSDEPNLFHYLRQAGYDVFWYGKNDALAADCFHTSVTEWNYSEGKVLRAGRGKITLRSTPPTTFMGYEMGDPRETPEFSLVQAAVRIIERRETDKPFCIFLPLISPHPPYAAPRGFQHMYHPADITGLRPIGLPGEPAYRNAIRKAYGLETASEDTYREVRALYYGLVSYSDWLLGHVLEALEKTGRDRDTTVMLFADHGDYAGDYGLVEKWSCGLEDVLTHVPLIIHVPGQTGDRTCQDLVMLFDVMATCLQLAGTEAQHTNFSRSLIPYLRSEKINPRHWAFAEGGFDTYEPQDFYPAPPRGELYYPRQNLIAQEPATITRGAMVRTSTHKLIVRPYGQSELYAYRDDPQELRNRFNDPDLANIQSELRNTLLNWYVSTTGISPRDKDSRGFPPYSPIPTVARFNDNDF